MDEAPSVRDEILGHLRHRSMTIAELSEAVARSRTAVLNPLNELISRGLVRRAATERSGKVGKPAVSYELVADRFERMSPAYTAMAPHLLSAILSRSDGTQEAMKFIGEQMHLQLASTHGYTKPVGLSEALAFLTEQGAEIESEAEGADVIVRSHSCPIGLLVRTDRCICMAIASFLGAATGRRVVKECDYAEKLTCCFRIVCEASA